MMGETEVVGHFVTQGTLGVAVVILGIVVIRLYRKIETLQARIEELHEMRLTDVKSLNMGLGEVIRSTSNNLDDLADKFEVVQRGRRD